MPVNRRQVIIGVVVAGGALAGYQIYKYERNKKAAAQAATDTAAAAASSGYGYGATAYGYGASAGSAYGYGASGGFPAGYYAYGTPAPPGGTPAPIAATTNAQWDQAAIQQMSGDGWDAMTVAGALGAYLNGREVNASQVNIIDAAIGIEGYPPVAGSSGYPPAIKTGGTTGGGQGSKVVVPNVRGKSAEQARQEIEHAGLKDAQIPANVPQGRTATVRSQTPAPGKSVNPGSTVTVHVRTA